jgi:lipopolysaccharide biosynthesis glycosyltransferase
MPGVVRVGVLNRGPASSQLSAVAPVAMTGADMTIAIATTTDRNYLPAACCQLLSVDEHLPDRDDVRLFLVWCDVDDRDRAEAERFFETRSLEVTTIDAQDVAEEVDVLATRWPRSAYLRLYFDTLFDDDVDRLVYFDADTRVCTSLEPLLDADLQQRPVGAVHDFIYYVSGNIERRRHDLFLGPGAPYLQSGVMVFDWPATIASARLERARDFLTEHPDRCYEAPDQDALNAVLVGDWTPLDPRWNLHELYLIFGGRYAPYIEHFTSSKPWSRERPAAWHDAAAWYRRELAGTAWSDFIPDQSSLDVARVRLRHLRLRLQPHVRDLVDALPSGVRAAVGQDHQPDDVRPWAPKSRGLVEDMAEALILEAHGVRPLSDPPEAELARRTGS